MTNEEIAQYNQLCNDWRQYNSIIWYLPTVSGALMSIVVTLSFQYVQEDFARFIILLMGGLLLLSLTIALHKHRFFHDTRVEKIREIEEKWTQNSLITFPVQRETTAYSNLIPSRFIRQSQSYWEKRGAVNWLKGSMWIMMGALFGLAFFSFFQMILKLCIT